ncbi:MAG: flagellar basal body-associated FliL family protein [Defluviitaleaceae bacterium]|nr:flagellar basal body-associated FliL family protein [Defluviitaleaceae bacterium]
MDKSKLMMIIIIALLVLLLGTVVGVTFYLINLVGDESPDFQQAEDRTLPPNLSLMDLVEIPLGERFSTNLAIGEHGTSDTVLASIVLGINNTGEQGEIDDFVDDVNDRIRMARGIVLDVLGERTYEQVRTPEGRNAAAEEIKLRLQAAFSTNLIILVEFPEWFVQRGR